MVSRGHGSSFAGTRRQREHHFSGFISREKAPSPLYNPSRRASPLSSSPLAFDNPPMMATHATTEGGFSLVRSVLVSCIDSVKEPSVLMTADEIF